MRKTTSVVQLAVISFLAVCLPNLSNAADNGDSVRNISVTGEGSASGPPDKAEISAGVQTFAATVAEATSENQAAIDKIMAALAEEGIEQKFMQTANYSIWPEQDRDPRDESQLRVTGYRVSNMINITVEDIDKVADVLGAVTAAGANSINGINFSVEDAAKLEQRARQEAMADAKARAGSLAELADVSLGEVLSISTNAGGGGPRPLMARSSMEMMASDAMNKPGIAPGQLSVTVQVYVTYAIE